MLPVNVLGAVSENTLSTDNGLLPISQLAGNLYYNLGVNLNLDLTKYGEKGSYAEWEVEQGKSYKLTLISDNCELVFFFNGEETKQLRIYEGINELTFTAPESKFGLILLNNYGSNTVSYLELKELYQLAIDTQPLTLYTVGTGAKGSLLTNTYSLSTSGTKTVGSLGKLLGIDLTNYGTEGSSIILSGLVNRVYSVDLKLDNKVAELDYEPPVQIKLIPDNSLGDVDIYSTRVSNNKLTILAVDTGVNTDPITGEQTVNKTGTTAICITKIERISTS